MPFPQRPCPQHHCTQRRFLPLWYQIRPPPSSISLLESFNPETSGSRSGVVSKKKGKRKMKKNQGIRPFPSLVPRFFSINAVVPSDHAVSRSRTQLRRRSAVVSSFNDCCKIVEKYWGKVFAFNPRAGVRGHLTVKNAKPKGKMQPHVLTLENGH